eukprot:208413_1
MSVRLENIMQHITIETKRDDRNLNHTLSNATISASNDDNLLIRRLERTDFEKGFLDILGQLTTVGGISQKKFEDRFELMRSMPAVYNVVVIEDLSKRQVVATSSIVIEHKFVHGCGKVGHIEDVVVNSSYRGKRLGARVVNECVRIGKESGCYKIILNCSEKNIPFYSRLGFKQKEVEMALYLDSPESPTPSPESLMAVL